MNKKLFMNLKNWISNIFIPHCEFPNNKKQAGVGENEFTNEYPDEGVQPPPFPPSHLDVKSKCLIFINYVT